MKVLSLFDGISSGRLALERAGIPVEKYYASEIDKYAIQVAQKNYPDTIQVGDVTKLNYLELLDVDMVIGGSPCQDLSIAKQNREGLRGARSGLFWKYVEALEVIRPKWFLLENVASMRNEDRDAITETLKKIYPEIECIMINSALVSAQQRKRYYWTNWHVEQPQDKGILLKDILESGYGCDVENQGKELCKTVDKTQTLMARDYKDFGNQRMTGVIEPLVPFVESKLPDIEKKFGELPQMFNPYNKQKITDKAPIQTTGCGSQTTSSTVMMFEPVCINIPEPVVVRKYPVNIEKLKILLRSHKNQTNKEIADALNVSTTKVEHWFRTDDCFAIPDPDIWFALKDLLHIETDEFDASITEFETKDAVYEKAQRKYHIDGKMSTLTTSTNDEIIAPQRIGQIGKGGQGGRIYSVRGKSVCLNANGGGGGAKTGLYKVDLPDGDYIIRKLTPVECERLQTLTSVKNKYIIHICSDNQKSYVSVENQNPKLPSVVGSVENDKKKELVPYVEQNSNANNLLLNDVVLPNVQVYIGENRLVIHYQNTVLLNASFAEILNKFPHLKAIENFARTFVLINTILAQTTNNGKVESQQKEINLIQAQNGNVVVKLCGNEIMPLVKYAIKDTNTIQKLLSATTLYPLSIKNTEQTLKILFYYVANVICSFIPEEIQKNCILNIQTDLGYTFGVSNTQRYKAIGNGWTVDVIAWILSQLPE